ALPARSVAQRDAALAGLHVAEPRLQELALAREPLRLGLRREIPLDERELLLERGALPAQRLAEAACQARLASLGLGGGEGTLEPGRRPGVGDAREAVLAGRARAAGRASPRLAEREVAARRGERPKRRGDAVLAVEREQVAARSEHREQQRALARRRAEAQS